ncbi:hypothetical protein [Micromonospora parva]|uniref:hypothetical protein n=1 Tax=Micromonospora parva TaxID=1464048 RepID=UPI0033F45D19
MYRKTGTLLTAALLGLTATIGWAVPAAAAPSASASASADAPTVAVSRLVLEPTERGYRGSLRVTVTNNSDSTDFLYFQIREAVAGSFFESAEFPCDPVGLSEGRQVRECGFPGGVQVAPGERRRANVEFQVLTTPRSYPMIAAGGSVTVQSTAFGGLEAVPFSAQFRSLDGKLTRPQTYLQDSQPDASIELAGPVTEGPENTRRVPVRVRYAGDAPHRDLEVNAQLPVGASILYCEPSAGPPWGGGAYVPGGQMMAGEERVFALFISRPSDPADEANPIDLELSTSWLETVPDVDPSDNTVTFNLAVAAS